MVSFLFWNEKKTDHKTKRTTYHAPLTCSPSWTFLGTVVLARFYVLRFDSRTQAFFHSRFVIIGAIDLSGFLTFTARFRALKWEWFENTKSAKTKATGPLTSHTHSFHTS